MTYKGIKSGRFIKKTLIFVFFLLLSVNTMASALLQEVNYLKENGFSEQQASAMLFVQKSQVDTHLATKKDVLILEKDIEGVKKEVEHLRLDVKKDMENMRLDFKKDMENMRLDFKKDMEILKGQLTVRLGSMVCAGFLLLAGYINYLNRSTVQVHLEDIKNQIVSAVEKSQRVVLNPPLEQKHSLQSDKSIKKP